MEAYDVSMENVSVGTHNDEYLCAMQLVASAGEILRAATPVVAKAVEGEYQLAITIEGTRGVTGLPGSLLQGNMLKGSLEPTAEEKTFVLTDGEGFMPVDAAYTLPANQARVVCNATASIAAARVLRLDFDAATSVEPLAPADEVQTIYSITGVRLATPQKGINIINNKKLIIK
jgi:nitrous oxidase accessory protein NosD